jgi:hypothetical protein
MRVQKALSILLAVTAALFGAFGAIGSARQLHAYSSWPKVDASVEEIDIHPIANNPNGNISLKFRYLNGSSEGLAWAQKSFLPAQGASFAHEYAVGTRHTIWLDPTSLGTAEVELGWNLETFLVPLFFCAVCLCLSVAAIYFWRFERPVVNV